jgi:hypothetical protein
MACGGFKSSLFGGLIVLIRHDQYAFQQQEHLSPLAFRTGRRASRRHKPASRRLALVQTGRCWDDVNK